uniref:Uncharacterized protein n=1 Tax=Caenorhabditis japonica TaxID=281687 RepID=A0A8R1EA16_CAEJA
MNIKTKAACQDRTLLQLTSNPADRAKQNQLEYSPSFCYILKNPITTFGMDVLNNYLPLHLIHPDADLDDQMDILSKNNFIDRKGIYWCSLVDAKKDQSKSPSVVL